MAGREGIRRERMIKDLERRGIENRRVLDAMRAVPRELFVEEALRGEAYRDSPLPIGQKQTISQPWIVARMAELLEPDGRGRVLEIGTGSGYNAAVLGGLFELVYTVERLPELSRRALQVLRELAVQNVHCKIFDGSYGWSEFAPYRAICVTAAVPDLPPPLFEQLDDGGRLVAPLALPGSADEQVLVRLTRRGGRLQREEFGGCRFVPLVGRYGLTS